MDDLYEAPQVASKMLVATMGLIETLTVAQRAHLVLPLDAPERQDWDIIPRPEGTGLSLHDLSRSQKILVWDLLAAALPLRTFTQATQIPQLEHVLRDYEADFLGRAIGAWRDPNNYYVTIFGRPGFEDTFAVRFYGHHLGINLTVIKERWITAGPSAMGQQPVVYDGTNKPLADEEAAGFAIITSLADDKLSRALIHPVSRPTSPPATCRTSARSSVIRDFDNDLGGDLLARNHPQPVPAEMPGVAEQNTRKVSSSDLDPGLAVAPPQEVTDAQQHVGPSSGEA